MARIEDLLEWCDEEFGALVYIKLGIQREGGNKTPLAYQGRRGASRSRRADVL